MDGDGASSAVVGSTRLVIFALMSLVLLTLALALTMSHILLLFSDRMKALLLKVALAVALAVETDVVMRLGVHGSGKHLPTLEKVSKTVSKAMRLHREACAWGEKSFVSVKKDGLAAR